MKSNNKISGVPKQEYVLNNGVGFPCIISDETSRRIAEDERATTENPDSFEKQTPVGPNDICSADNDTLTAQFPFLDEKYVTSIKSIISYLPDSVGDELQFALTAPNINNAPVVKDSKSYIIIVCTAKANPQYNQIQLRKSTKLIGLNPGINVLAIEKYPEIKYGFYPKQVGGGVMSPNENCQSILEIDMSHFDASEIDSTELMFGDMLALRKVNLSNVKFSNVKKMDYMFARCISLKEITINNIHTFESNVLTSADGMFNMTVSIKSLGLSHFGGSSLYSIVGMFRSMDSLEKLDLSGWNLDGVNVGNIEVSLFEGCEKLKKIYMIGCNDLTVKMIQTQLNNPYVSLKDVQINRVMLKGAL